MTWLEHLGEGDLALLARVAAAAGFDGARLRHDDAAVESLLRRREAFAAVFEDHAPNDVVTNVTPFLTFAVLVHRVWDDLGTAAYVAEWMGPRQRLPVFDGSDLAEFAADPCRRLFITEMLASFTHVVSGVAWVPTRRGLRKQRFSELDPVRLASLLEVVNERERAGIYRRLGDLALFLTGVFPDHTESHGFGAVAESRLLRSARLRVAHAPSSALPVPGANGPVGLLEQLGARWYRLAAATAFGPLTGTMRVVTDVADRFGDVRRILNYLTDRYLLPYRGDWFGESAS